MVAGEYLKFFVFTGMSLDQALRSELRARVHVWWPPKWVPADHTLCSSAPMQRSVGAGRPHGSHLEILLPLK